MKYLPLLLATRRYYSVVMRIVTSRIEEIVRTPGPKRTGMLQELRTLRRMIAPLDRWAEKHNALVWELFK